MANKKQKTHAEKAASAAQGKKAKAENTKAGSGKATSGKNEPAKQVTPAKQESQVPVRLITSVVFLGCGILFGVILFACEGALLTLIQRLVHGLIGRVGFIISIPVLL